MVRLPYETKAGYVSEAATLAQLTEYLRLAEEACYTIGHLRKANDDFELGEGFLKIGKMLAKTIDNLSTLATMGGRSLQ